MLISVLIKSPISALLRTWVYSACLFTSLLALSSCSSPEPKIVEVTRIVPQTVIITEVVTQIVTEVVEIVVTATPQPATPTPESTRTPEYQKWVSMDVVDEFIAAGLEAEDPRPMTKDDYGPAPMTAVEGTRFLIPSLCADCGGRIFSFSSPVCFILLDFFIKVS